MHLSHAVIDARTFQGAQLLHRRNCDQGLLRRTVLLIHPAYVSPAAPVKLSNSPSYIFFEPIAVELLALRLSDICLDGNLSSQGESPQAGGGHMGALVHPLKRLRTHL